MAIAFNKTSLVPAFLFFVLAFVSTPCGIFAQTREPIAEARIRTADEIQLRSDIVAYAELHLGTRYRPAGKTPGGFDCSGFVYHVMKTFDMRMASSSDTQELQGEKTSLKEALPGDLLFFRRSKAGRVFHVAMVYENKDGDLRIIHSASRGVVIDRLKDSSYWRTKFVTVKDVLSRNPF